MSHRKKSNIGSDKNAFLRYFPTYTNLAMIKRQTMAIAKKTNEKITFLTFIKQPPF